MTSKEMNREMNQGIPEETLPVSVSYQHMLDTIFDTAEGIPVPFSCSYVKSTGEVIKLCDAQGVRFEGPRRAYLLVKVAGGVRRLRTVSIVTFNGADVWLW